MYFSKYDAKKSRYVHSQTEIGSITFRNSHTTLNVMLILFTLSTYRKSFSRFNYTLQNFFNNLEARLLFAKWQKFNSMRTKVTQLYLLYNIDLLDFVDADVSAYVKNTKRYLIRFLFKTTLTLREGTFYELYFYKEMILFFYYLLNSIIPQ